MGIYHSSGSLALTSVSGSSRVGLFAADGSLNVVLDHVGGKGIFHPSGALRVNNSTGAGVYDATGAYYINHVLGHPRGGTLLSAILLSASTLAENSAEDTVIGNLSVTGVTGTPSYTLVDSASNKVKLASGVIKAGSSAANYETATSFTFTVSVSGVTPAIANTTFTVYVTDVNEFTPAITSDGGGATASVSVAENTTAVTTVTATDADGTAVITYSISGGADAAKFTIGSSSGVLTFLSAPDFETPTDADTDNDYVVVVMASDGTNSDTQTITVTVTDVSEGGGGFTPSLDFSDARNSQYLGEI